MSSLSALTLPDVYAMDTIDTSTWTAYDLTDSADATSLGCSAAAGDGTTDDGPEFDCYLENLPEESYVWVPAGATYHLARSDNGGDWMYNWTPTRDKWGVICEDSTAILEVENGLDAAVRCAARTAQPGDVVLLSPACSSYDMFPNYRERGRAFRRAFGALRDLARSAS